MRGVLTSVAFFSVWMATLAAAQTGRINITQAMMPLTITASGSYRVVENLHITNAGTHGIAVHASDVSVDLHGHELRGPGQSAGCGIFQASDVAGLTLSNGFIAAWQQVDQGPDGASGHGVLALGGGNVIANVQLMSNSVGAYVTGHSIVSNCNVSSGRTGVRTGINGIVYFVTAYELDGTGFALGPGTRAEICTCYGARTGFYAAANAQLVNCTAYANELGIEAEDDVHITLSSSYQNDLGIHAAARVAIVESTANLNTSHGIDAGHHAIIRGTVATGNRDDGIRVLSDSEVTSCSGSENGSAGIRVLGTACLVEGNKTVANRWGIRVEGSDNTVVGNTSGQNNDADFDVPAGNTLGEILPFVPGVSNTVEDANFRM